MNKKKLLIFGSCVSRDAIEHDKEGIFEIVNYFARQSLASLYSGASVDQNVLNKIESSFQKRCVEYDMKKSFWKYLENTEYDVFLLDLIDERFHLVINSDGTYHTFSKEYKNALESKPKLLNAYHEKKFQLWKKGFSKLLNILKYTKSIDKLYINKVFWTDRTNDGTILNATNVTAEQILIANTFLKKMYDEISNYIPENQFISYPEEMFFSDKKHKWGVQPFHYNDNLYLHTMNFLKYNNTTSMDLKI